MSCADSASAPAPASGSSSDSSAASASVPVASAIPGTPFTSNVLSSPMPRTDRAVYLSAVTSAVDAFLYDALSSNGTTGVDNDDDEVNTNKVTTSSINTVSASSATTTTSRIAQVTLLLPELNPSLDVYDRRFLLQVTWAVISSAVTTHGLRPRVLVQGRRAFGAIPLSVAGLRRHFDADLELSVDDWSRPIRSGDLEEVTDVDDDDDVIIIISPTNAVSCPVVQSVADCVRQKANGRPVILINPRLDDVPSHSGVMQVSGRADRIAFVDSFEQIFYLRLLFDAGSVSCCRFCLPPHDKS